MPTIQHPTLGRLAYRTTGEGATALLLLHGWAGSSSYFDALLSHLDPDLAYSVSMDLPGHGASGEPKGPYTLDQIADAAIAVADAAGAETFVLLGFSMSAKFAQYVAQRHPDRTIAQILVAGSPTGRIPLPAELVDDWCARAGDAERLADVVRACATRPIPEPLLQQAGRAAAVVTADVLRQTLELCADSDFSRLVSGSTVPTLVVGGTGDWIFTPDALSGGVVAPLARARLELLDCGHEVPLEAPEQLARLVAQFIEQQRASQSRPAPAGSRT